MRRTPQRPQSPVRGTGRTCAGRNFPRDRPGPAGSLLPVDHQARDGAPAAPPRTPPRNHARDPARRQGNGHLTSACAWAGQRRLVTCRCSETCHMLRGRRSLCPRDPPRSSRNGSVTPTRRSPSPSAPTSATLHDGPADTVAATVREKRWTDGRWTVPATLFVQVRCMLSVSEGGLEPPRPNTGTSTSS